MPEHKAFDREDVPDCVKDKVNHLGLLTQVEPEMFLAIPPGAHIRVVDYLSGFIMPIRLVKVNHKNILVRCDCGREGCTREAVLKFKWRGWHNAEEAEPAKKLVKAMEATSESKARRSAARQTREE